MGGMIAGPEGPTNDGRVRHRSQNSIGVAGGKKGICVAEEHHVPLGAGEAGVHLAGATCRTSNDLAKSPCDLHRAVGRAAIDDDDLWRWCRLHAIGALKDASDVGSFVERREDDGELGYGPPGRSGRRMACHGKGVGQGERSSPDL